MPNALVPQVKTNRDGSHPAQKEEAGRAFGKELGNMASQQSVDASKLSEPSKLSAKPLDLTRKVALQITSRAGTASVDVQLVTRKL